MKTKEEFLFEEKIPLNNKLAYGGIRTSFFTLTNLANAPLTFYYQNKMLLGWEWISLAWLIFAIWNAINDPIFGILEERTKSEKYGRRIPYIRFGAPILGITFIIIWLPIVPPGSNQVAIFLYFLTTLLIFDTISTIIGLAQTALSTEMALSSNGRTQLEIFGNIMVAIGTGISIGLPLILLTGDETTALNPILLPALFIIAIISTLILFYSSYHVKENKWTQIDETLGLFEGIKECIKNRPFLIYQAALFTYSMANGIFLIGIYYYYDYIIKIKGFLTVLPLLLMYGMFILFSTRITSLNRKIGMKKVYIYVGFILSGISLCVFFIAGWSIVGGVLAILPYGIGSGAISILNGPMSSNTIDYDETITGKRRETTYAGIGALINKPTASFTNVIFLGVIALFGFVEPINNIPQEQNEFAQLGIMIALTLIPAAFMFLSALIIKYYPLEGPEWEKKKFELKKIHEEKERKYIEHLKEKGVL